MDYDYRSTSVGSYATIFSMARNAEKDIHELSDVLYRIMPNINNKTVLVAGLGNTSWSKTAMAYRFKKR
jgi:hypothetical protein